jgi:hypothetical protein
MPSDDFFFNSCEKKFFLSTDDFIKLPSYEEGRVGIPSFGLTLPLFCACPKSGHGFATSYVMVVLVFSELRGEVIVRFVDIGGIVDHHCLNFIFLLQDKKVLS